MERISYQGETACQNTSDNLSSGKDKVSDNCDTNSFITLFGADLMVMRHHLNS